MGESGWGWWRFSIMLFVSGPNFGLVFRLQAGSGGKMAIDSLSPILSKIFDLLVS